MVVDATFSEIGGERKKRNMQCGERQVWSNVGFLRREEMKARLYFEGKGQKMEKLRRKGRQAVRLGAK